MEIKKLGEVEDLEREIEDLIYQIEYDDDRGVSSFHLRQLLKKKRRTLEKLQEKYEIESKKSYKREDLIR
jgi:hypothetical protein